MRDLPPKWLGHDNHLLMEPPLDAPLVEVRLAGRVAESRHCRSRLGWPRCRWLAARFVEAPVASLLAEARLAVWAEDQLGALLVEARLGSLLAALLVEARRAAPSIQARLAALLAEPPH